MQACDGAMGILGVSQVQLGNKHTFRAVVQQVQSGLEQAVLLAKLARGIDQPTLILADIAVHTATVLAKASGSDRQQTVGNLQQIADVMQDERHI